MVTVMMDSGMFLRDAANAGDLKVDPDAAREAVAKLGDVQDKLKALLDTMASGGKGGLQLGANPVGVAMANKSQTKADGDESLHAAVQMLHTQATNAHLAVKKAMDNYSDTEQTNKTRFQH